jgi:hypothetical protein
MFVLPAKLSLPVGVTARSPNHALALGQIVGRGLD